MLEMRRECDSCGKPLTHEADAFICSYECTFCAECTKSAGFACPNCGGELVPRPRRLRDSAQAVP